MPELPLLPELPLEPEEPDEPELPDVPSKPLSPVLAKVATISSLTANGLESLLSTGETVIVKNPLYSEIELIVNKINLLVSALFVNFK